MLKTFLSATAISGLMFSAALAQAPSPSPPPAATPAPSATAPAPKADMATGSSQFVAAQKSDQWLSSKFKGTNVLGPDNEKVGDVNDLLFDKDGKVLAVIIGVGGFLGIGEKDVALEMSALQVVPASTTTGTTTGTATTAASDDPQNIKLKVSMNKDQLKNAPSFERYKAPARTTGTGPATNTGTTRPVPPATTR